MNFRYKQRSPAVWRNTFMEPNLTEDRSYRKLRLALASALFTDSAFTSGGREEALPPEVVWGGGPARVRVFDELWRGVDQEPHWLGQPLDLPVHLAAKKAPDLLNKGGESWTDGFIGRFQGEKVDFSRAAGPIMKVSSTAPSRPAGMSFMLPGIDLTDDDLFVSLRLSAEPLEGYPISVPRRVVVSATPAGEATTLANEEFTWAGSKPFEASFYFQDVGAGTVHLRFEVEGEGEVYLEKLTAHSAADGRYREYERGVVFANPSTRSYTFNVGGEGGLFEELLGSGVRLRRIRGSEAQHPAYEEAVVNDGSELGEELILPAKDALFVVKVQDLV